MLQGPGENAGVVDIGDGLAAAFKMESHNHPSYVEPFQGAATGVGGILRDIFTMGARPIAVLDSLRFGPISSGASGAKAPITDWTGMSRLKPRPTNPSDALKDPSDTSEVATFEGSHFTSEGSHSTSLVGRGFRRDIPAAQLDGALAPEAADEATIARNRRILDGVVRGIANYGNCFGVPTVGGEVQFEPGYSANPLVNVLALGIAKKEDLFFAKARGVGNPVIYAGAKTGRDGIHGASLLASAEFTEKSRQRRPNVGVGDRLWENRCRGLPRSADGRGRGDSGYGRSGADEFVARMAARGGLGIEIELAAPQRSPA